MYGLYFTNEDIKYWVMVDYVIPANFLAEDHFKNSTICEILSKSITEQ